MRLLAFSDLHRDLAQARRLVELAAGADAVAGVGDFASVHRGLDETIAVLRAIDRPTLIVPGNNETDAALREACEGWDAAVVLHGATAQIGDVVFFGLGGGVPVTPWDWSFDLDEDEAEAALASCPPGAVLLVHSPPKGHVDGGFGSAAVLRAIEACAPQLVLCGHIHECWGQESRVGESLIVNLGPEGRVFEV